MPATNAKDSMMKNTLLFCQIIVMLLAGPAQAFNYTDYATVLKNVDSQGMVDYRALKKDPNALNRFTQSLAQPRAGRC